MKIWKKTLILLLGCCFLWGCQTNGQTSPSNPDAGTPPSGLLASAADAIPDTEILIQSIPAYKDQPYAVVNNNVPYFGSDYLTTSSYEEYASLDALGRCGSARASLATDLMPTSDRESISSVKPSGWNNAQYDVVEGNGYVYNRSHLIGFQLAGENANADNLITGTRYMNVEGMLPFENMVADYIKETGNHVAYRVTPLFLNEELVCRGVLMEAESVEDQGAGIEFNVFCYNVQPGVDIDYATGQTSLGQNESNQSADVQQEESDYILNTNTKKFHRPDCASAQSISPSNRQESHESRETLIQEGYSPCSLCKP